jgi:ribonuclease R
MIDGLVHVTALKRDYYQFDPAHHRLVGELSGRVYRLGDRLEVVVARVNMEDRKIDFDLVWSADETDVIKTRRKGGKKRAGRKPGTGVNRSKKKGGGRDKSRG